MLAGALVAVVLGLAVFGATVVPRWWAQRVADQVDGDLSTGTVLGLMYGFVCTLLPLAALALVYRFRRRSWKAWLLGLAVALLLAAPNLITLGIVLGVGDSAHAADRTLDVEAPFFRGGMLIGAVAAALLVAWLSYLSASRRRARATAALPDRPGA